MKNCNKKILAQYLYDLAKESKSEFIEISKDSELIKIAEKMNLVVPNPDIAILKTIYARTDVPNRNNIVLPKEAAKKALPTLVGKQANWSHLGKNYICGWILDAKLEKDLIVTYIAIYKSLFPEEFEKMKEMVKENKMAVSFEIWNKDENGNSVLHDLGNGIKSIDPIIYHGVGILIEGETPACKEAYAEKLLATANKKIIDEAEKIANEVFNQDLVFATLVTEEPICVNCGNCNHGKEVKIVIKKIDSEQWICPHCEKEIGEKELFCDENQKWYHRPCQDKGEIILPKENNKKEERKVELEKLYANVTKEEEITFDIAMAFYYATDEERAKLTEDATKWTRKFINGLPDSAFAAIEPAYPEKTQDKNARHLPHHNGEGDLGKEKSNANLDLPHYKNALARVSQVKPISDSISAEDLQKKAGAHLERHKDALEKSSEETKPEIIPEETKPVKGDETNPAEIKGEETKEVKAQTPVETITPKIIVKVTRISSDIYVDTYKDGTLSGTSEGKSSYKTITEYSDGTEDVVEGEMQYVKKYSFAELEEAVKKAKEELITLHVADLEAKTNEVKVDLEKKITDKETEIANLRKELEKKSQEQAAEVKPEETKASLEIGDTTQPDTDPSRKRQKKINRIAYGHD